MLLRTSSVLLALALAACNSSESKTDVSAPAASATMTAQASAPMTDTAAPDIFDPTMTAFTAAGDNDSAWRAVVENGQLYIEGANIEDITIAVTRSADTQMVSFMGEHKGQKISLNIHNQECQLDGQEASNSQDHEFTTTLVMGDQTLNGCALVGVYPYAPT